MIEKTKLDNYGVDSLVTTILIDGADESFKCGGHHL